MKSSKKVKPDVSVSAAGASLKTKKSVKGYDPTAMENFAAVALTVNTKWKDNDKIVLMWITQPEFEEKAQTLAKAVATQGSGTSVIPAETKTLRQMVTQMDVAVKSVKRGIDYKFQDDAVAQYARYGIIKQGSSYRLPRDRDKRLVNITLMLAAVAADGFDKEEWGTAFWTDMQARFAAAIKASGNSEGNISVNYKNIVVMMREISKVATALRFVLRGNYPETYQAVYRDWGWQRESY